MWWAGVAHPPSEIGWSCPKLRPSSWRYRDGVNHCSKKDINIDGVIVPDGILVMPLFVGIIKVRRKVRKSS